MHLSATVDDSCSGTTAIVAFVDGKTLCVANVGDSRACCGVRSGKKLLAVDLSHDQTPFRCVVHALPRLLGSFVWYRPGALPVPISVMLKQACIQANCRTHRPIK
jgi:hypothetical protein